MGQLFNGVCLPDGNAAADAFCSSGWPRVSISESGAITVKSCAAVDATHVAISSPDTPASGTPSTCLGGSVDLTINGNTYTAYAGGAETPQAAVNAWFFNNEGITPTWITGGVDGGSYTIPWGGQTLTETATPTCGSGSVATGTPAVVGASSTLAVAFPACDAAEPYTDSAALFTLSLVALVLVWGVKNFVYKLVTNQ